MSISFNSFINKVPGEPFTSSIYGGLFSLSSLGIKSTPTHLPFTAFAALRHSVFYSSVIFILFGFWRIAYPNQF